MTFDSTWPNQSHLYNHQMDIHWMLIGSPMGTQRKAMALLSLNLSLGNCSARTGRASWVSLFLSGWIGSILVQSSTVAESHDYSGCVLPVRRHFMFVSLSFGSYSTIFSEPWSCDRGTLLRGYAFHFHLCSSTFWSHRLHHSSQNRGEAAPIKVKGDNCSLLVAKLAGSLHGISWDGMSRAKVGSCNPGWSWMNLLCSRGWPRIPDLLPLPYPLCAGITDV